jgi:hypothetical protein
MSPPDQNPAPPLSALTELQAQLHDTQSSLASHVDKIRALEGVLAEHEAIKREVSSLHEIMEERKREMESARSTSPSLVRRHEKGEFVGEFEGDDDDAGSIRTIVPHELERVEEEDEDQLAAEEEEAEEDRRRRREELGRPRTPEPTGMGITEYVPRHMSKLLSAPRRRSLSPPSRDSPSRPKLSSVVDELTQRLSTLSDQLETALELSSSLQVQHATAQTTISALETKVSALETLVHATQSQVQSQTLVQEASRAQANEAARHPSQNSEQERESLTQMLDDWKTGVEGQWSSVQEEWNQERDRLSKAKDEWENKVRAVEAGLGSAAARVDTGLASLAAVQTQLQHQWHLGNGDAKHNSSGGLVTPPSPRSLSADSTRPRQRRKRSNSSRGRSRSQLGGARPTTESDSSADNSSVASASVLVPGTSPVSRPYSPSPDEVSDREVLMKKAKADSAWFLATPDSPHHPCPTQSADATPSKRDEASLSLADGVRIVLRVCDVTAQFCQQHPISISTVVGVLVLSVAAAAVIWRVKPE